MSFNLHCFVASAFMINTLLAIYRYKTWTIRQFYQSTTWFNATRAHISSSLFKPQQRPRHNNQVFPGLPCPDYA